MVWFQNADPKRGLLARGRSLREIENNIASLEIGAIPMPYGKES